MGAATATAPTRYRRPDPRDLAPAPGWVGVVDVALTAALALEPPGSFACSSSFGRIRWERVSGPPPFVELLWALEELSAALCELCGAPGMPRERRGMGVRTLCPAHSVAFAAAGARGDALYDGAWLALGAPRRTRHGDAGRGGNDDGHPMDGRDDQERGESGEHDELGTGAMRPERGDAAPVPALATPSTGDRRSDAEA